MIAFNLAILSALLGFAGAYFEVTSPVLGFYMILVAAPLLIGSMIPVLKPLVKRRRMFLSSWLRLLAGVASLGAAGYLGYLAFLHPLNDISTDLNNPPKFERPVYRIKIKEGRENLGPEYLLDRSYKGNPALQTEKYKEISPLQFNVPATTANPIVLNVLAKLPQYKVVLDDRARNRVEMETSSELFHFVDDIVIESRAIDAFHSQVAIRSRSRVGKSDLGANAKRVNELAALIRAAVADYENQYKQKAPTPAPANTAKPVAATTTKPVTAKPAANIGKKK